MLLKATRFVAVMLAALTLGLSLCHLMQLPSRLGWDQYLWVGSTMQGGLYATFATLGAVIDVAAVIALALLAYFVREHGRPGYRLALAAAILFVLALVLWWVLVYPVNVELAKWVNGPVPADWTDYRSRWEWGHAIIALVELIGFAALTASVLADTPRGSSS
jgi:Na+/H+-dicarboxylate symporter